MKQITGGIRSGKTTELIRLSAETGGYIVCLNMDEASRIQFQSQEMGLKIPFPITFDEFKSHQYYGRGIKGFLIDNADMLLKSMSSVPVLAITMSNPESDNKQKA
jgi:hypothetical protein